MQLRSARTHSVAIAAAAALTIAGMIALRASGQNSWWGVVAMTAAFSLIVVKPYLAQTLAVDADETLRISPWGIRRTGGHDLRESIAWHDLKQVSVLTTSDGPFVEDLFIVLRGSGDSGVVVPHTLAVESDLLAELKQRLETFDDATFAEALKSTREHVFVVWQAPNFDPRAESRLHHWVALSPM
jgi:hypothetical protein